MTRTTTRNKYTMGYAASAKSAEAHSACANTNHNLVVLLLDAIFVASILIALIVLLALAVVLSLRLVLVSLVLVSLVLAVRLIISQLNMCRSRQIP